MEGGNRSRRPGLTADDTQDDTQGPVCGAAANTGDSLLQTRRNGCFSTKVPLASFNLTSFYQAQLYAHALLLEEGTGEHSHAVSRLVMSWGGGTWRTWHSCSARVSPGPLPFPSTSISRSVPSLALVSFFLYS